MIKARYTQLYKDWKQVIPEGQTRTYEEALKLAITSTEFPTDNANELVNIIGNIYDYYEVGDIQEMFDFMIDTFYEYKDYYIELITNYRKAYDYSLNNKRVVTKFDGINITGSSSDTSNGNSKDTDIQLPNKVVETTYEGTPSAITKHEHADVNGKTYNNNTQRTGSTETEFNNEFIDLKNKYLDQIRNVMKEFALKFNDCFYMIY